MEVTKCIDLVTSNTYMISPTRYRTTCNNANEARSNKLDKADNGVFR